jgi:type IV pilus assembly protein PilA
MEVLVVMVVIAILAIMAIPSFQDQMVRDNIASALPLVEFAKKPLAASWAATQTFPANNAAAGLPPADRIVNNYISSVQVQHGALHITFGNRANRLFSGRILTIRPAVVADAPVVPITWVCGNAEAPDRMTLKGENRTSVPANYLPFICRPRLKN